MPEKLTLSDRLNAFQDFTLTLIPYIGAGLIVFAILTFSRCELETTRLKASAPCPETFKEAR